MREDGPGVDLAAEEERPKAESQTNKGEVMQKK